jgi:hypothetical protein
MGKRRISITGRRFDDVGQFYLYALAVVLVGYAVLGRGFAYIGYPPVFIGEMALLIGFLAMFRSGCVSRVLTDTHMLPLIMLMAWGALHTAPFLDDYGVLAVRDAAIWGYALFAFTIAAVLIAVPERLVSAISFYRKFTPAFLLMLPVIWLFSRVLEGVLPEMPFSGQPMLDYKCGDACVHLAGCFAFIVAMGSSINPWIAPVMVPINLRRGDVVRRQRGAGVGPSAVPSSRDADLRGYRHGFARALGNRHQDRKRERPRDLV